MGKELTMLDKVLKEISPYVKLTGKDLAESRPKINAIWKKYDDERKRLKKEFDARAKEYMQPLTDLKEDATVAFNEVEDARKELKRQEIVDWFNTIELGFELDGFLDKVFDDRWLNKTFEMSEIELEVEGRIREVRNDLRVVTSMKLNLERYKETLDLQLVMDEHEEDMKNLDSIFINYVSLEIDATKKDVVEKFLEKEGVIYKWH